MFQFWLFLSETIFPLFFLEAEAVEIEKDWSWSFLLARIILKDFQFNEYFCVALYWK